MNSFIWSLILKAIELYLTYLCLSDEIQELYMGQGNEFSWLKNNLEQPYKINKILSWVQEGRSSIEVWLPQSVSEGFYCLAFWRAVYKVVHVWKVCGGLL